MRHYVTHREGRGRKFLVIQASRRGPRGHAYTTVSRHWTWKAADRAAHRLNAQGGTTY